MQKAKVMCLILAVVLASVGTVVVAEKFGGTSEPPILPDNSANAVLPKPEEGDPSACDAIDNLFIAQGELQRKGGFVGVSRGTTTSAGVTQDVYNNRTVIEGNVFKEMITLGIVKNAYQLYLYGDNYLYRKANSIKNADSIKWDNTASKYSEKSFLDIFGHRSDALTGYILNKETVLEGRLEKEENGLFTYRYVLDIETAPARMLREMRANSGMKGYSEFQKAEIVVTMDANWQVKTLTTDCKYKVPMLGGLDCVEDITETFSDLTDDNLPEKAFFEQFLDADIDTPIDEEPDALTVLMNIFEPYATGDRLNVSLTASNGGDTVLSGLVSANIDIEDISNISVDVILGDDLFVSYEKGNLYITYQDFKASTSVDGIMGLVGALMPSSDNDPGESEDDLLSQLTYKQEGNLCVVSLPLDLNGAELEVNIYANVNDDKYEFLRAEVVCGDMRVDVKPTDSFTVPQRSGEYPELLGLADILNNGVIYGNIEAFGMSVDMMFDIAAKSLYAESGDLALTLVNDTVYVQFGAVKLKLALADAKSLLELVSMSGKVDTDFDMPQISLEEVLAVLSGIKATTTDKGVAFTFDSDGMSIALNIAKVANGWNIENIILKVQGYDVVVAPKYDVTGIIPEVNANEYYDVTEMAATFVGPIMNLTGASSFGYGADFNLAVSINGVEYGVQGNFGYDVNGSVKVIAVMSCASGNVINAEAVYVNGTVYLTVNGVKVAFEANGNGLNIDVDKIIALLDGIDNDVVKALVNTVKTVIGAVQNFDLISVDFANMVKEFAFNDGKITMLVNADLLSLGEFGLELSVVDNMYLNVALNNLTVADGIEIDMSATIKRNVREITAPNADEYVLNMEGSFGEVNFNVSLDMLAMDVNAAVEFCGQTIYARFVNNEIFVKFGKVALRGRIDELSDIIAVITKELETEIPEANIDLSGFDIAEILRGINIDLNGNAPCISIALGDNVLSLNLAQGSFDFDSITATIGGQELVIRQSSKETAKLDVSDRDAFVSVKELTEYVLNVYKAFANVQNDGLKLTAETDVTVCGKAYRLELTLAYNNGLHLVATINDEINILVNAEVYLVNNNIYLSVNGVRLAAEMPSADTDGNLDLTAVLGMLQQAYGYNDVLDSIIDVVNTLPDRLTNVKLTELINRFTFNESALTIGIAAEQLGLSDFELTLSGTSNVMMGLTGLTIGKVNVSSLTVQAEPSCEEVIAPATEDYITDVNVRVMGYDVTARLDLYNKTVTAFAEVYGETLVLLYENNTVYVSYGAVKVKLSLNDVDRLLAVINKFTEVSIPEVGLDINVEQIINAIVFDSAESGLKVNANIGSIALNVNFDRLAMLDEIVVNIDGTEIALTLASNATFPKISSNGNYADLVVLAETYADGIASLMNAEGYNVNVQGQFAFGSNVYDVAANVIYNNGLYVNAELYYNNVNAVNAEVWFINEELYVSVGNLKFALRLDGGNGEGASESLEATLDKYMGYNSHVDALLSLVKNVIAKFNAQDIVYGKLTSAFGFDGNALTIGVNGNQFDVSEFAIELNKGNGLAVRIADLTFEDMTFGLQANVTATDNKVVKPAGDFTTNLSVKIDEENTIHANLDLINGIYRLRIDSLNVWYSNGVVKIAAGNNVFATGDITRIIEICKEIDALVNEFSGREESVFGGMDINALMNIDIKSILTSLVISTDNGVVRVGLNVAGIDMTANLANGLLTKITAPVMSKIIEITPANKAEYFDFTDDIKYVAIDEVLEEFLPSIKALVHTNSWKFEFNSDSEFSMDGQAYRIVSGSYFEFYYCNVLTEGMNTFKMRAVLNILKQRSANDWQEFMSLDIVYKDGSIYVTDTGRRISDNKDRNTLRLTIDVATIERCAGLYAPLVAVVPQIGQLVESIGAAMSEAEDNAALVDYSTLLRVLSYDDGIFSLIINGQVFLSKLGDITISASQTDGRNGLILNGLQVSYDNMSFNLENIVVTASDVTKEYVDEKANGTADENRWFGGLQYAAVQDILAYDYEQYHIDLNSMYELLSAFIKTATPEDDKSTRAFDISGTIPVSLIVSMELEVELHVDIDENNKVQIAVRLSRPVTGKLDAENVAFNDYGGDGYIFYDGLADRFTIVRNSYYNSNVSKGDWIYSKYCTQCGKEVGLFGDCNTVSNWSRHGSKYLEMGYHYAASSSKVVHLVEEDTIHADVDSATFMANAIDYILELMNFSSSIESEIRNAITKENNNDYGIEDILKDYSYTAGDFNISADLSPIDSSLGTVKVDILHDEDYTLTNLNGEIKLISICTAQLKLELNTPVYGTATNYVANRAYWNTSAN